MITVHHLNNSRSQRILWLLEELGLDYEIKRYERDPDTLLAPDSMRKVHPLGKSPIVQDGDVTLIESGAIIESLADHYGSDAFVPAPGTADRLRYLQWLHYAEGSMMAPLTMKLVFDRVEAAPAPIIVRQIKRAIARQVKSTFVQVQIDLHLDFLESELSRSTWFVGEQFTPADIQMSFPVEVAASRAGLDKARPKLMAYLDRIHARPAYKKALERGGRYDIVA